MDKETFNAGIQELVDAGTISLPWGYWPGSYPGGEENFLDEKSWDLYIWNPPEHLTGINFPGEYDPNALNKPTWNQIADAAVIGLLRQVRRSKLQQLEDQLTLRIRANYIGDQEITQTAEQEIFYRLRSSTEALAVKDTERDRLHGRFITLNTSLTGMTLSQLESLDFTDDVNWDPQPT